MLFLSKLIPAFVQPLGLAILLGIVSLLLYRSRRIARLFGRGCGRRSLDSFNAGVANLLVSSMSPRYAPQPIDEVPMADVAVVLGGILGQPVSPRIQPDLADPVDRVIEAWRLYRAGKIKAILIAGGNLPWATATEPSRF